MFRYDLKNQFAVVTSVVTYCITLALVSCNRDSLDPDHMPTSNTQDKADSDVLKINALPLGRVHIWDIEVETKHQLGLDAEFTEMPDEPGAFINLDTGLVCQLTEERGAITKLRYLIRVDQYRSPPLERPFARKHFELFCNQTAKIVSGEKDFDVAGMLAMFPGAKITLNTENGEVVIRHYKEKYHELEHLVFEACAVATQ